MSRTYIQIDGALWFVTPAGELQPVPPGTELPPDAEILDLDLSQVEVVEAKDALNFDVGGVEVSIPMVEPRATLLPGTDASQGGSGQSGSDASVVSTLFGNLRREGIEVRAESGFQTRVERQAGDRVTEPELATEDSSPEPPPPPPGSITLEVEDGGDGYVNQFENAAVLLRGTTSSIPAGSPIVITLIDAFGQTLQLDVVSADDNYRATADVSDLAEGPLTARAAVVDQRGDDLLAEAESVIDTLAEGLVIASSQADDGVIDGDEARSVNLSGEFDYVNPGALVTISLADQLGDELVLETELDEEGLFVVTAVDISDFSDGEIVAIARTLDQAGNPAFIGNTALLTRVPEITLFTTDEDGVFNAVEALNPEFFGAVINIEDGQPVLLEVFDLSGDLVDDLTTVVVSGYDNTGPDLSDLLDGPVTVVATGTNLAGLSATAELELELDATAIITVRFDDPDGVLNDDDLRATSVSGEVIDVEDGQRIEVVLSSDTGGSVVGSTVVDGNRWSLLNLDITGLDGDVYTATASTIDLAGNPATATDTIGGDPAEIIIDEIVTATKDDLVTPEEDDTTPLAGTTEDIEPGQPVNLLLTDSNGDSLSVKTTVSADETWSAKVNISALADGEIMLDASSEDLNGNLAFDSFTFLKGDEGGGGGGGGIDANPSITIEIVQADDGLINSTEVVRTDFRGTVTRVPNGADVDVIVTAPGLVFAATTTVEAGAWQIDDVDLSGFPDGTIGAAAAAVGNNGKEAIAQTSAVIDTVAITTAEIVDNDGVINAAESFAVEIRGDTTDVQLGRLVTAEIYDSSGNVLSYNTLTRPNSWTLRNEDLGSLDDGTLYLIARTSDRAGNSAYAPLFSIELDTQAEITISSAATATMDNVINSSEQTSAPLGGDSAGIESGQVLDIQLTDATGLMLAGTATVGAGGDWSASLDITSLADGDIDFIVSGEDVAGNPAGDSYVFHKDATAQITAQFNDPDDVINASEAGGILLSGSVLDVEDGQPVLVQVADASGGQVNLSTSVAGGAWTIADVDVSTLSSGDVTVRAGTIDLAGNVALSLLDTTRLDLLADILIDEATTGSADDLVNVLEQLAAPVAGTVVGIEAGEVVSLSLKDTLGAEVADTGSVQADGSWSLTPDISGLADGTIDVSVTVSDVAGNPAADTYSFVKDTAAALTAQFDDPDTINAAESLGTSVSGTETDVGAGSVGLLVADSQGNVVVGSGGIGGGLWSAAGLDVSALEDGQLNLVAAVRDPAGNPAVAGDSIVLDTLAGVQIDPAASVTSDNVVNSVEAGAVTIAGSVIDIESGQPVNLSITDSVNAPVVAVTAVDDAGGWSAVVDLASLNDGSLTVNVTSQDIAGNADSDALVFAKDTVVSITTAFSDPDTINAAEAVATGIEGDVADTEDGGTVNFSVVDIDGGSVAGSATISLAATPDWSDLAVDVTGLVDGQLLLTATTVDAAGNSAQAQDTITLDTLAALFISESPTGSPDDVINAIEMSTTPLQGSSLGFTAGDVLTINLSDSVITLPVLATIDIDGLWSTTADLTTLADGNIDMGVSGTDTAGNPATATFAFQKDATAGITAQFDDADATINSSEAPGTPVSGTVTDVEDGQPVQVTVTDVDGGQVTATTIVAGGGWIIPALDVSSLQDGVLSLSALTIDVAGNTATGAAVAALDQTAQITIDEGATATADNVVNDSEELAVPLTGSTSGFNAADVLTVALVDRLGASINTTASVQPDDSWNITEDLSTLADGEVFLTVSGTDTAGNLGSDSFAFIKDTANAVNIFILDGGDGLINGSEALLTDIVGGIAPADNKTVTLSIDDAAGNGPVVFTPTAGVITWSELDIDLLALGFEDGLITAEVTATDGSGNTRTAADTSMLDTTAGLTAQFDDPDIINAAESAATNLSGTATGIEDGQVVQVVVTDSLGFTVNTTATVAGSAWAVSGLDVSGLNDGGLSLDVLAQDVAGNTATGSAVGVLDASASIVIGEDLTGTVDDIVNSAEETAVALVGDTLDIDVGQTLSITLTDDLGAAESATVDTAADGSWATTVDVSALADGTISFDINGTDVAGNPASDSFIFVKDTQASITVQVDDADQLINALEAPQVDFSGTITDVDNGRTVLLLVRDGAGALLSTTTTVSAGTWQVSNFDLSTLAPGELMITAATTDIAGNAATANTVVELDPLATVLIDEIATAGADNVINQLEQAAIPLSGSVLDIEAGQTLDLSVSDGAGGSVDLTTTVAIGGTWSAIADISTLADGSITLDVAGVDVAGNPAADQFIFAKDTEASLTGIFDDPDSINAAESVATDLSGSAGGIVDGRDVRVRITDEAGNSLVVTPSPVLATGDWSVTALDVSSLVDGTLTLTSTATDVAGNTASAQDTITLDTTAAVQIDESTTGTGDDKVNAAEDELTPLSGSVSDVEPGQVLSYTLTDSLAATVTGTATVNVAGQWSVSEDISALVDGQIDLSVSIQDIAGNPAVDSFSFQKDATVNLTAEFVDSNPITAATVGSVDVQGTSDIESGRFVQLTVSDESGASVSVTDTVLVQAGGGWSYTFTNLDTLQDGTLTLQAAATDSFDNPATASDANLKDTLATLEIQELPTGTSDDVINADEQSAAPISGTSSGIEAGRDVAVRVSDAVTDIDLTATVQAGGGWTLQADISTLLDGPITVSASATDAVGNPASDSYGFDKDTLASVTIDAVATASADDLVNQFEQTSVTLTGTTVGVEAGQTLQLNLVDAEDQARSLFTEVQPGGSWQIQDDISVLADGTISLTVLVEDIAGNDAEDAFDFVKDTEAVITAAFDDPEGRISADESLTTAFGGTSQDVEPNQTVNYTISDGVNNVAGVALVQPDGTWSGVENLSGFDEGEVELTADVVDVAGNPANASAAAVLDFQATLDIDELASAGDDDLVNAAESIANPLSGVAVEVEAGQTVSLELTDPGGGSLLLSADVLADGNWSTADNIAALDDGIINVAAEVADVAGNVATDSFSFELDTQAQLSIEIVDAGPDAGDDFLNTAELESVSVQGTVTDVEDGRVIEVRLQDALGFAELYDVTVAGAAWSLPGLDFTGFANGEFTASASVTDVAGNTATADDAVEIKRDSFAGIDIDTGDGFDILAARTFQAFDLEGIAGLEPGVPGTIEGTQVTVTLSDGVLDLDFTGTVDFAGNWLLSDVDPAGLSAAAAWTLQASLIGPIGNEAVDTMPTLELPTPAAFNEQTLSLQSPLTSARPLNIEFAELSFSDDQSALDGLRSAGQDTSVSLANGNTRLRVVRTDGELVLEAQINDDDTVDLSLYQAVDQASGADRSLIDLLLQGVQNDADGTSETVLAPLAVLVRDSEPLVVDDLEFEAIEAQQNQGSLTDNDSTLEGPLVVVSVDVQGDERSVPDGGEVSFDLAEGLLTVFSDGDWTLDAARDQFNLLVNPQIDLTYAVRDTDFDVASGDASIVILDGELGQIGDSEDSTPENIIGSSALVEGEFDGTAGSDDISTLLERFALNQLEVLDDLGLTSNGVALSYGFDSLLAKSITADAGGETVFTVAVGGNIDASGNLEGDLDFELLRPLDHVSSDDALLGFALFTRDTDLSPVREGLFLLTIEDGTDPVLVETGTVAISEVGLGAGSVIGTGSFQAVVGSDALVAVEFAPESAQTQHTSGGSDLSFDISAAGDVLTGYLDDGDSVVEPGEAVYTITIDDLFAAETNSDIGYTVELIQPVDQTTGGVRDDPLDLAPIVRLSDFDGDVTSTALEVLVTDGESPDLGDGSAELSERPRDSSIGAGLPSSAAIELTALAGSDVLTSIGFDVESRQPVFDTNGNRLTHNGENLFWQNNFDGSAEIVLQNGSPVFRAEFPVSSGAIDPGESITGVLEVTLEASFDHVHDGEDEVLQLEIPLVITDSDLSTGSGLVTISITDGKIPEFDSIESTAVNELGLLDAADNDSGGYAVSESSDSLLPPEPDKDLFDALGLERAGSAITLASEVDDNGWWQARDEGDTLVFQFRFNPSASDWDVRFRKALDHPDVQGANTLDIDIPVRIGDIDGDLSALSSFTVTVTDDIPVDVDYSFDFVEGASISKKLLSDGQAGADRGNVTEVQYAGDSYPASTWFDLVDPTAVGGPQTYGRARINSDGTLKVETDPIVEVANPYVETITFDVTDNDGDVENNQVTLNITDSGVTIDFPDTDTLEDTLLPLDITIDVGDVDVGETITEIEFDTDSLSTGTLPVGAGIFSLDGVPLATNAGGNPILTSAQLNIDDSNGNRIATPDGDLAFTPALNISDQTATINLRITTTLDDGLGNIRDFEQDEVLSVTSVADVPVWDPGSTLDYAVLEDAGDIATTLSADLFDVDGSELLSYRVENIPAGLTLSVAGGALMDGDVFDSADIGTLSARIDDGLAGTFSFDAIAIATEQENDETAEASVEVSFEVAGVANTPTLAVRNTRGFEDELIDFSTVVDGNLTDTDGSETLSFEAVMPAGWVLLGTGGAVVTDLGGDTFSVQADEVSAGNISIQPLEDISSVSGTFTVDVQSVATESTQDGIQPATPVIRSAVSTFTVELTGVVDAPEIGPGTPANWDYDPAAMRISSAIALDEDTLIHLNFDVATTDDDGSESSNLLLHGIPEGFEIVDSSGDPLQLPIPKVDATGPYYQVDSTSLTTVYLRPTVDFSGRATAMLSQVITEPDGDSESFDLEIRMDIEPVVDSDGSNADSAGGEDFPVTLMLMPDLSMDVDGSETVTGMVIDSIPAGSVLQLDGEPVDVSAGIDLETLLDGTSPTLVELLTSGRITWFPPIDAAGAFALPVEYEITDTSGLGDTDVVTLASTVSVDVAALVENDTRLESDDLLNVVDGADTALDLAGLVGFFDEDADGSEVLDYLIIEMPSATDYAVSHPNGAIHDGTGRWLIPAAGLSDAVTGEQGADILAGATLSRKTPSVGEELISVQARITDGQDAELIETELRVQFDNASPGDVAQAPGVLPDSIVDGVEAQLVDTAGHLNVGLAGDGTDTISFRIPVANLPAGAIVIGPDVIADYNSTGKQVVAYLFTEASVPSLRIANIDEDRAGAISVQTEVIATDIGGDSIVDDSAQQIIEIELQPAVDGFTLDTQRTEVQEDVSSPLGLSFAFADSNVPGQGIESPDPAGELTLQLPDGGALNSAIDGVIERTGIGSDSWNVLDFSRLDQIEFLGPRHVSGDFRIIATADLIDEVTGLGLTDTAQDVSEITITVLPVTDASQLTPATPLGDEDSFIALTSIDAALIDLDGSEVATVSILGVPAGAGLYVDTGGGSYVALANNGVDGGSFNGEPTNGWSADISQVADLALLPPLDFAGDIPLTLQSITVELGTDDFVETNTVFTVGVRPVGDPIQNFGVIPVSIPSDEGSAVVLPVNAETTDVDDSETIDARVTLLSSSDATALDSPEGVRVVGSTELSRFVSIGGIFTAFLTVKAADLGALELLPGPNAFGNLDVRVFVNSDDRAVVLGDNERDFGAFTAGDTTVDIAAVVDAPDLNLSFSNLLTVEDDPIDLGLMMALNNPAPGEAGELLVSGLPDGGGLTAGAPGSTWVVDQADVDGLGLTGASAGPDIFLELQPRGTLDADSALGVVQQISVRVIADGDNIIDGADIGDVVYIPGAGSDDVTIGFGRNSVVFRTEDFDIAVPPVDTLRSFQVSDDSLDFSGSVTGPDGDDITDDFDLSDDGSDTTLDVFVGGDLAQRVVIEDATVADLYGGSTAGVSEADLLDKLLDDQTLLVGG